MSGGAGASGDATLMAAAAAGGFNAVGNSSMRGSRGSVAAAEPGRTSFDQQQQQPSAFAALGRTSMRMMEAGAAAPHLGPLHNSGATNAVFAPMPVQLQMQQPQLQQFLPQQSQSQPLVQPQPQPSTFAALGRASLSLMEASALGFAAQSGGTALGLGLHQQQQQQLLQLQPQAQAQPGSFAALAAQQPLGLAPAMQQVQLASPCLSPLLAPSLAPAATFMGAGTVGGYGPQPVQVALSPAATNPDAGFSFHTGASVTAPAANPNAAIDLSRRSVPAGSHPAMAVTALGQAALSAALPNMTTTAVAGAEAPSAVTAELIQVLSAEVVRLRELVASKKTKAGAAPAGGAAAATAGVQH